ncbi:MAG: LysR family transcriptional regulator [Deltaproteobacteria bacterium]|nr:LysR family transcriptional regulator [Deltaproteobacteria bacterium]
MVPVDDLPLLAALDALLSERHVTRAARRLGITQSSMSHHLARLRLRFGDALLVRAGRAMALTPRAEAMAGPLREALDAVRRAVADADPFDPATTSRTFTLATPDLLAPALPDLLAAMNAAAPGAGLRALAQPVDAPAALASGACELLLGAAPASAPGVVLKRLGAIHWCVLARRGHPAFAGRLTVAAWERYPHVVVRSGNASPNRVARALEGAGVKRRVGVAVPGFLAAPWVVARTDMLFTAPRELVGEVVRALDLVMLDPPVALPAIPVAAMWHERVDGDAGHRWLRGVVVKALKARLAVGEG